MTQPEPTTHEAELQEGYPVYPQNEAHTWNAFPMFAVETGGYSDIEVIDPWSGRVDTFGSIPAETLEQGLPAILRWLADQFDLHKVDLETRLDA